MTWNEGDIDAGWGRLHYYRRGSGTPLILAHGVTDNGKCWDRVATVLQDRYDVVAFDARYHGLSEGPAEFAMGAGEDIVSLAEALALDRPAVMGHSMGAASVAHAIGLRPDLFRCAVLEDPPWRDSWEDIPAPAAPPDWKSLTIEQIIAGARTQGIEWNDAEMPAWAESKRQVRLPADWRGKRMAGITNWRDIAAAIGVPTLLVRGGNKQRRAIVSGEIAAEASRLNPRIESVCLATAGHNIRREAFPEFVAAVTAFLGRNCRG